MTNKSKNFWRVRLYVYNHQGQNYKVFNNKRQLDHYFENQPYAMLAEFY